MNGRKTYSKAIKKLLFKELKQIQGNPTIWREDIQGRIICFPSYGDINSSYGWNIHHIDGNPENNKLENLIAVHYESHEELHK